MADEPKQTYSADTLGVPALKLSPAGKRGRDLTPELALRAELEPLLEKQSAVARLIEHLKAGKS